MRCIVANIILNLCRGELQGVERLEIALIEYEIAYRGGVEDVDSSTSWDDIGPPHTYMNITDLFSSWTSWGNDSSPSTSQNNY
jgi:hypothetical protein